MTLHQWKTWPWTQILLALILLYQVLNHSALLDIEKNQETQSVIDNMQQKETHQDLKQLSSDLQEVTEAVQR
jgi:hypothetical protein